ncbi:hypothetical protein HMPREF9120_02238 [Neisseria sp. oral taxon 020 str. F0370]|nr:hypothetical protein HMPREF9120_02238 [Neisseria sp. oral taxon 020 str. F0370]
MARMTVLAFIFFSSRLGIGARLYVIPYLQDRPSESFQTASISP